MLAKHCPICDRLISHSDVICPDCRNSFEKELFDNFMTRCNNCGYPLVADLYECPHCREFHNFYVYSLSPYSSYFSRRILEFYKFNGKKSPNLKNRIMPAYCIFMLLYCCISGVSAIHSPSDQTG